MLNNYFYLARAASELNAQLSGFVVHSIYSQEKDKLFFNIGSDETPFKHLIISCIPHLPYLQIRQEHHKARKNTVEFFTEFCPTQIERISICTNDRVIKIQTSSADFYFTVRGGSTNLILLAEDYSISFKKMKHNSGGVRAELSNLKFCSSPTVPNVPDSVNESGELIAQRKISPIIPKDLIFELQAEFNFPINNFQQIFSRKIGEILNEDIEIGLLEDRLKWLPFSWKKPEGFESISVQKSYLDAVNLYLSNYHREKKKSSGIKRISNHLSKELEKQASKMNKLKGRLEKGSQENSYRKIGQILLSNLLSLKKGLNSIVLADLESGEEIKIKLKPELTPEKNANLYFEKAKDEKKSFEKSRELFDAANKRYNELRVRLKELEKAESVQEIETLKKNLNIKDAKMEQKQANPGFRYRKFIIDGKYECYVGRDSKSNDYLSVKFSKQNDYWFHARGLAGSHTLLRVQNTKENVPKPVLKAAASIAAFFSKGKTASVVPVSYTFAKYVYKKKGMEPGKVMISKEKVMLVSPEIPKNVEMSED